MKILKLRAENVKKLTVVEITPTGNLVQITGKNGQGKTSVLDAIWWALAGAEHIQGEPIRRGEDKATVTLELGTEKVELTVERRFTKENSYLTVRAGDGVKSSPQRLLDEMLGALSFDPLSFMRSDRKVQYDLLRSLVKLPVDPAEVERLNKADFETRARLNKDAKRLTAQAESLTITPDLPDMPIDEMAIVDEIQQVGQHNAAIERVIGRRAEDAARITTLRATAARMRADAERLEAEATNLEKNPLQMVGGETPKDAVALRESLAKAKATNAAIERARERKAIEVDARKLERQAEQLTAQMEKRRKDLDDALAAATLPVPGLGFGDNVVTFHNIPLDQASDAEQLLTSAAIAAAFNPKLRVLRIRDGSLLDNDHLAWLGEFADKHDCQIWLETVGDGGPSSIIMEDGHVRGA